MPILNYLFRKMTGRGKISIFQRKRKQNNTESNNNNNNNNNNNGTVSNNIDTVNTANTNQQNPNINITKKLHEDIFGDNNIIDADDARPILKSSPEKLLLPSSSRYSNSNSNSIISTAQQQIEITKNKYIGSNNYGLPLSTSLLSAEKEKSLFHHSETLQKRSHSSSINSTFTNASNAIAMTDSSKPTTPSIMNLDDSRNEIVGDAKKKKQKYHQHRLQSFKFKENTLSSYIISSSSSSAEKKLKSKISKMGTGVDGVVLLCKELKSEWNKRNSNLQKCGLYLDQLKIELTKLSYLPTEGKTIPKQDLIIARDVLEIAVEYSVAKKDIPAFERYISQLKCYYYDYRQVIGESENMYKLLGLNLLYLLSVNRVSEFHTELELLSTEVIQKNQYIRPILSLEQYIMEGRYNKIFQARGSLPTDLYNFFMEILVETVRDEIGACLEKSYEKISIQEAAKRLNLKTKEEVKVFGSKRNWSLSPDGVYYFVAKAAKPKEPLPSVELAEQAIFYARELEMIV